MILLGTLHAEQHTLRRLVRGASASPSSKILSWHRQAGKQIRRPRDRA